MRIDTIESLSKFYVWQMKEDEWMFKCHASSYRITADSKRPSKLYWTRYTFEKNITYFTDGVHILLLSCF